MGINRRNLLRGGIAAGALGAVAGLFGGQQAAADPPRKRTYLFVHGGWSGPSNFNRVIEALQKQGHDAFGIELPGHGTKAKYLNSYLAQDAAGMATEPSPIASLTLNDYVTYTRGVVTALAESHGPVILIGHSLGGITIGKVAEAVPQAIRRLVYIAAFMPVGLASALEYTQTPEAQTSTAPLDAIVVADPQQVGALRINWRSTDPAYRARAKAATFADVSDEVFTAFSTVWQSDEPIGVIAADARPSSRWDTVPRTYVRFTNDQAIPPALQDRMIREANARTPRNQTDVKNVTGSHLGPFASATEVVSILSGL